VEWDGSRLPTTFVGPTQLRATVAATLIAKAGNVSVVVIDPNGKASGAATFTISAPAPPTWTLSLHAAPVPVQSGNVQLKIDNITWVVTPDWSTSQPISFSPGSPSAIKNISLPAPPGPGHTVKVTISGKWSTDGGYVGGYAIPPQSGTICSAANANTCVPDLRSVVYKGSNETIAWSLDVVYAASQAGLNFGVVSTFQAINP
jgi:hypothetical protein